MIAVNRSVAVSHNAGIRALLVHAIDERAKRFYEHAPVSAAWFLSLLAGWRPDVYT